tara:strand:- start:13168 stop:14490 length:1323 start_codon:yes stop_codon:yes gene_type:complete
MKKILLITSTLFSLDSFAAASAASTDWEEANSEVISVTKKAVEENPGIAAIYEEGAARRTAQFEWLNTLRGAIVAADPDVEKLEGQVTARIKSEKENYDQFAAAKEAAKKARVEEGKRQLTWVLRSDKVGLNLSLATAGLSRLLRLIDGTDSVFSADPKEIPYADTGKLFVSSEGRTAITLLQMGYLEATGQTDLNTAMEGLFGADWLKTSPWHMGVPVPDDVTWDDMEKLSSLGRVDAKAVLFETGNGYGFGASHGDEGPEAELSGDYPWMDCSSRVWHDAGKKGISPSTLHWWLHSVDGMTTALPYSDTAGVVAGWDSIMSDWHGASDAGYRDPLVAGFTPVHFKTPDEFRPGMVWVRRGINTDRIESNPVVGLYGAGGHTGTVLGIVGSGADTKVIVDTANRAMGESNGYNKDYAYGIESHSLIGTGAQQLLFRKID